jgi:hypothetical protein
MHLISVRGTCCLVAVSLAWSVVSGDAAGQGREGPKNAAAIRKALDEKITLDFNTQSLQEAIDHLQQKTRVRFVLDSTLGLQGGGGGVIPGIPGGPGMPFMQLTLKSDNGKVRTALQNMLSPHQLTYVILADSVLITTEEFGHQRQMRQRVDVDLKEVALKDALKKLADDTGATLIIDPRQSDKAQGKVSIQLDDVTVETAVRLLTELADLSSVRVGNVLFVTTEHRAEKLRKENQHLNNMFNPYSNPVFQAVGGVFGGFGGGPPVVVPAEAPAPPAAEKKEAK